MIVIAGVLYGLFVIAAPVAGLLLGFSVGLSFAIGYLSAIWMGTSRPIAYISGGGVLLCTGLIFFIFASRADKRVQERQRREAEEAKRTAAERRWSDQGDFG